MTRTWNIQSALKHVCVFSFVLIFLSPILTPLPAQACVCYTELGAEEIVDGSLACEEACGTGALELDPGKCTCPDGSTSTIKCEDVCKENNLAASSVEAEKNYAANQYVAPDLEIEIPGVVFTKVISNKGSLDINWLGEYITGVYKYLLSIGTIIAIVFVMIGGLQYAFAGGHGDTGKAKTRIRNAIVGLVLLLFVYFILWTINPNTTFFSAIKLTEVSEIELDAAASGYEGAMFGKLERSVCDAIVESAKNYGECKIKQSVISPTGNQPGCSNHHWFDYGAAGDFNKIKNLDYGAGWGASLKAPFDGVVTYEEQKDTSNKCGNRIYLTGSGDAAGAKITICHAKDFVNDAGEKLHGQTVAQGDIIGHIGGSCCEGQKPPSSWSSAQKGWCNVAGTACTDPNTLENCSCQIAEQSGNTSGPHVHITWDLNGGDLLNCLDY
jgi:hypothetical protein